MEHKKQPSQETLAKILNFFLKTSVPRILAEERKKSKEAVRIIEEEKGGNSNGKTIRSA
jgi:hypothetical protein